MLQTRAVLSLKSIAEVRAIENTKSILSMRFLWPHRAERHTMTRQELQASISEGTWITLVRDADGTEVLEEYPQYKYFRYVAYEDGEVVGIDRV